MLLFRRPFQNINFFRFFFLLFLSCVLIRLIPLGGQQHFPSTIPEGISSWIFEYFIFWIYMFMDLDYVSFGEFITQFMIATYYPFYFRMPYEIYRFTRLFGILVSWGIRWVFFIWWGEGGIIGIFFSDGKGLELRP